jgi:hypothetical protein
MLSRLLAAFALLFCSCTMRTFDCDVTVDDVEATRAQVVARWPDVAEVFDRMDVYCVDDTNTFQTCATAGYARTEGCTMWLGNGPYRGKMFHDNGEPFTESVIEKAQHWHLMLLNGDDGCPSHQSACGWVD